ncbi:YheC/YheD family protein [Ectobacillus antri]|jgi:glutathione synthase/RimK-type ligase-like ATP-grasp enzyme|uniref:YheC/YheD family protein n=1 Tax=Ectobacillus antri TaxID=2486280 RepID=A0ABT6H4H2_9BACI|nr:YheC/YheD family protein [Ectobacillus antri]MDG4656760.1 YheC/YheD family protein [Ectobacillus antri]MDG5753877.1 YheC/YheD family protein [Ectobacillus antri]
MFSCSTVKLVTGNVKSLHEIRLSKRLAMQWKLRPGDSFTIFFGLTNVFVNITSIDEIGNHIVCHPELLSQLLLPEERVLRCSYLPSHQELLVGPVIAVITEIQSASFGNISAFCEELAILSEKQGYFFYVTSLPLWSTGYTYEDGSWVLKKVPFPSVVHNRIHSRKTEQSDDFASWKDLITQHGIPYFNERFLNKWEIYNTLENFSYLQPYVPRTYLFTSFSALQDSLSMFPVLFIKPAYGSQGRHIFKVTKQNEQYILDYTTFQGDISRSYSSVKDLFLTLKHYVGKRPYIIQQGLSLYTYTERPVDFRLLCHLSDTGWRVSSSVARVSSPHEFVSNVAMGGEMYKLEEVLYSGFEQKEVKHLKKLLYELAIEIAKCINQSYEGLYGEFGMDLAIDTSGNPWLLEVNVKPSKNMPASDRIRPSVRSILDYCCSIAQQPLRRN